MDSQPTMILPFSRAVAESVRKHGVALSDGFLQMHAGFGARVPFDFQDQLWEEALAANPDPLLGVKVGLDMRIWHLDSVGLLLMSQADVRSALKVMLEYLPVISEGFELRPRLGNDGVSLEYLPSATRFEALRAEVAMACVVNLYRWLTGMPSPLRLLLRHAPRAPAADYERLLGGQVLFSAPTYEIFVPESALEVPLLQANARMSGQLRVFADQLKSELLATETGARVRELLRRDPRRDRVNVAGVLGMSERTLTRRLAEEETSFREIRDAVLCGLATERLRDGLRARAIADQLGFSDESAFLKAFRRWTGTTPAKFRVDADPRRKTG